MEWCCGLRHRRRRRSAARMRDLSPHSLCANGFVWRFLWVDWCARRLRGRPSSLKAASHRYATTCGLPYGASAAPVGNDEGSQEPALAHASAQCKLHYGMTQRVGVDAAQVVVDEVAVDSRHRAGKWCLLLHHGNQFADSCDQVLGLVGTSRPRCVSEGNSHGELML